ncbi:hypothetical protein ACQCX5_02740 [Propionibacteriaceae bacterium G57]|uniref:hypothetical protein n=1 Tax=Aestuariimicrobium sp. G57 TaxID=3418485 RepID=UPI003DA7059D
MPSRRALLSLLPLGGVAVLLSACSQPDDAAPTTTTLAITASGGTITPNGQRLEVTKGSTVVVTVTSDIDLHVHVHGYETEVVAKPGVPAEASFVADKVGSFEIETHDPTQLVANLIVR